MSRNFNNNILLTRLLNTLPFADLLIIIFFTCVDPAVVQIPNCVTMSTIITITTTITIITSTEKLTCPQEAYLMGQLVIPR